MIKINTHKPLCLFFYPLHLLHTSLLIRRSSFWSNDFKLSNKFSIVLPHKSSMLTPKASAIFLTVSTLGSGVAPDSIFVIVCKVMPASFDNLSDESCIWSGRVDLNHRPLPPQRSALPLRYAPTKYYYKLN